MTETRKLPAHRRAGNTFAFRIFPDGDGGDPLEGYITTGEFEDGALGEVFLVVSKHGGTIRGLMNGIAILISHCLQAGHTVDEVCGWIEGERFDPTGLTDDPDVPEVNSVLDYVARKLRAEYGTKP
jgi:ribonucleoside-diphosphate reductase alpha chain